MDATPLSSATMHRLTRVVAVAVSALVLAPAAAMAGPRIQSVTLTNSGLAGDPLTVDVAAIDPSAPVTAVDVRFPGHPGAFSESACAVKPNGKPDRSRGRGRNHLTTFKVPWLPDTSGTWPVTVGVTSGGCGVMPRHATKDVKLRVGVGDLPALPLKPGKVKHLVATAAGLLPSATACANASLLPTGHNDGKIRSAITCLINGARAAQGLGPVSGNRRLKRAAASHTRDMLAKHYFDHQRAGGASFVQRLQHVGYWPASAGENIAYGTGTLASPYQIFVAWMNSPPHRANILNPAFSAIGTGVAPGCPSAPGGATFTSDFGKRY